MKTLVKRIYTRQNYTKAVEWGKLITITGAAQVVVQGLGFIGGILVIRLLPTHEYALYTLANTMLGTMTILADGGIVSGVTAQGGKVWQDREKLGAVLATGLDLRKKFAVGSLLVVTPVLLYLLRYHDASWLTSVLIVISLIPAFFSALSGTLLQIPLKLQQDIAPLQKNQIGVNIGRLGMLVLTLFVFPWAFVAVLAAGLPQIWANMRLRTFSGAYADWSQKPDPMIQKDIIGIVKRILPVSIYYCLSGQLTIWIISFFGSTLALAQIGALSRLSVAFSFFGAIFSILMVPRFARLPNNPMFILKHFFLIQLGLICMSILIVTVVSLFSENILWILGDEFSNLTNELVLVAIGSSLSLISVSTNELLSSRGIVIPPVIFISCVLAAQILFALTIQLNELVGVLLYSICTTAITYALRIVYLLFATASNEIH